MGIDEAFFNQIARRTRDNVQGTSVAQLLRLHKPRKSGLLPYLYCPCDDIVTDYRSPPKLYGLVLKYLHLQLKYKSRASFRVQFVNFVEAPTIIYGLRIHQYYKNILGQLLHQCSRHSMLTTMIVGREVVIKRVRLREDHPLFKFLEEEKSEFPPQYLRKVHQPAEITELILRLPKTPIPVTDYWQFAQYVASACVSYEIIEHL